MIRRNVHKKNYTIRNILMKMTLLIICFLFLIRFVYHIMRITQRMLLSQEFIIICKQRILVLQSLSKRIEVFTME